MVVYVCYGVYAVACLDRCLVTDVLLKAAEIKRFVFVLFLFSIICNL